MARYDFSAQRLFVDAPLAANAEVTLERGQANYLMNVLRLRPGSKVIVFNGRDGEWQAVLVEAGKKQAGLRIGERLRPQDRSGDLHLLFAPLKHARLDYMVQKAVEMGASVLQPVITRRTQAARVNMERMRANVIEAAEQCGVLSIPAVAQETKLGSLLAQWPPERWLVFCDEDEAVSDPVAALRAKPVKPGDPMALLIGPEGGFDPEERKAIAALPAAIPVSLGPRILRADTAAVAALAAVQIAAGDWRG